MQVPKSCWTKLLEPSKVLLLSARAAPHRHHQAAIKAASCGTIIAGLQYGRIVEQLQHSSQVLRKRSWTSYLRGLLPGAIVPLLGAGAAAIVLICLSLARNRGDLVFSRAINDIWLSYCRPAFPKAIGCFTSLSIVLLEHHSLLEATRLSTTVFVSWAPAAITCLALSAASFVEQPYRLTQQCSTMKEAGAPAPTKRWLT